MGQAILGRWLSTLDVPAAVGCALRRSAYSECVGTDRYTRELHMAARARDACKDCAAMLLIELDGADAEQIERDYDSVGELCSKRGAIEVYVADNHTTRERIWRIRRNIS